jgi:hypothetical protein
MESAAPRLELTIAATTKAFLVMAIQPSWSSGIPVVASWWTMAAIVASPAPVVSTTGKVPCNGMSVDSDSVISVTGSPPLVTKSA